MRTKSNKISPDEEMHKLEQRIAYVAARQDIENLCRFTNNGRPFKADLWYNITTAPDGYGRKTVEIALRYLSLRGMVVYHSDNQDFVQIKAADA